MRFWFRLMKLLFVANGFNFFMNVFFFYNKICKSIFCPQPGSNKIVKIGPVIELVKAPIQDSIVQPWLNRIIIKY